MPSLFRRKPTDLAGEPAGAPAAEAPADPTAQGTHRKGYTPSKRELGVQTPKRATAGRRTVEPPPANRREAYRRMRERQRTERAERMAAMRAGDESALPARDRGPERAMVRDVVDSRRTVGTWFFAGALIVLLGSSPSMPPVVRFASNLLWVMLAVALVVDTVLICRRVKRLMGERFRRSQVRLGSLYGYAFMRALSFRRMRIPSPRVKIGEKI